MGRQLRALWRTHYVSMKSGLEGRNNMIRVMGGAIEAYRLNEVRPRRPEQCVCVQLNRKGENCVSMKSGLEGRNNPYSQ